MTLRTWEVAKGYQIIGGPAKDTLERSFFRGSNACLHCDNPSWPHFKVLDENGVERGVELCIDKVERTNSSYDEWKLEGSWFNRNIAPLWFPFKASYSTKNRTGTFTPIDER